MNRTVRYNLDEINVSWVHLEDGNLMLECGTDDDALEIIIDSELFHVLRETMTRADGLA